MQREIQTGVKVPGVRWDCVRTLEAADGPGAGTNCVNMIFGAVRVGIPLGTVDTLLARKQVASL